MSPVITFLLLIVAAVILVVYVVFFDEQKRAARHNNKAVRNDTMRANKELIYVRRQLAEAKNGLIKIAANDTGNPSLEAQIVLEDLSKLELKELES